MKFAVADMKSTVINWFKNTGVGMWYTNKKNGFEVLSERGYERLCRKYGEIKVIVID